MNRNSFILALLCLGTRFGFAAEPLPPPLPPIPEAEVEKIRAAIPSKAEVATPKQPRKLLVFYRSHNPGIHPMAHGNKMFELLAEKTGAFTVTFSQDYADLSADRLKQYDAVFMNNAGGLKFAGFPERQGLLEFVRGGKGLAGQHWATDNFRDWPEAAVHLFGGVMNGHPFGFAQVRNEVQSSPLTAMFPAGGFPCHEEYYIFSKKDHRSEPNFQQTYDRSRLRVLLSIDVEKSPAVQKTIADIEKDPKNRYHGKLCEDNDYALSWIRREGEGRVFYTVFGHAKSAYWNPAMVRHMMAGVQYALGDLAADDSPSGPPKADAQRTGGTGEKGGVR
jgi:hypothetical protein